MNALNHIMFKKYIIIKYTETMHSTNILSLTIPVNDPSLQSYIMAVHHTVMMPCCILYIEEDNSDLMRLCSSKKCQSINIGLKNLKTCN